MLAELARNRRAYVAGFLALEEGVARIADEIAVSPVDDAESANLELVVQDNRSHRLNLAERHALLEGENLDVGHRKAIE